MSAADADLYIVQSFKAQRSFLPKISDIGKPAKQSSAKRFIKEPFNQEAGPLSLPHIPHPPSEPRHGIHRTFGGYVNLPEITDTSRPKANTKPAQRNVDKPSQATRLPPIQLEHMTAQNMENNKLVGNAYRTQSPFRTTLPPLNMPSNAVCTNDKGAGDMSGVSEAKTAINPKQKAGKRRRSEKHKSDDKSMDRKCKTTAEEKKRIDNLVKVFDDLVRAPLVPQN